MSRAWTEDPRFVPSEGGPLATVLTRPGDHGNGRGVVVCPGGWYGTSTNRNRVVVRLARCLAERGYHVVRFDWHGVGDSYGEIGGFELDAPFPDDVMAAARRLDETDVSGIHLVGVCFGARSAMAAAARLSNVRGVVLTSFPVPTDELRTEWKARKTSGVRTALRRSGLRGMADPEIRRLMIRGAQRKWRSLRRRRGGLPPPRITSLAADIFLEQLETLRDRRIPVCFLFGHEDFQLGAWQGFATGDLGEYVAAPDSFLEVEVVPGAVSSFGSLEVQQTVIDAVTSWIVKTDDAGDGGMASMAHG